MELGQHIIKLDDSGEFKSHLLPISTPSTEGPSTPQATAVPSPAPSEASSANGADGDGHLMAIRKNTGNVAFEDIPLRVRIFHIQCSLNMTWKGQTQLQVYLIEATAIWTLKI